MLISHQENFIAGQPRASTMTVPENVSIRYGVVSPPGCSEADSFVRSCHKDLLELPVKLELHYSRTPR
jgi:hypothetical protein